MTKDFVGRPPSLFASPSRTSHFISKNAISFFLRDIISCAGASGVAEGPALRPNKYKVSQHFGNFLEELVGLQGAGGHNFEFERSLRFLSFEGCCFCVGIWRTHDL